MTRPGPRLRTARARAAFPHALALVVLVALLGCGACDAVASGGDPALDVISAGDASTELPRTAPSGPNLVLANEFDAPAGSGPNEGLPFPVWINDKCSDDGCMGTLAAFTPESATQDGRGNLVMSARPDPSGAEPCGAAGRCRYSSSRLSMLDWAKGGVPTWGQRGGRFEARIRATARPGLWPAFWTVGSNQATSGWPGSGEIDIFEARGQIPDKVTQLAHGPDEQGNRVMKGGTTTLPRTDISQFHVYAVDWNPDPGLGYLSWSVDGVERQRVTAREAGPMWRAMSHPHSLILSLAVGGWAGEPDTASLSGEMVVDYVRVYGEPAR